MERDEKIISFVAEWADPISQQTKRFLLKLHCCTNQEVEMRDLQTKRQFLKKTPLPSPLTESGERKRWFTPHASII